jgi:hypothetical protein
LILNFFLFVIYRVKQNGYESHPGSSIFRQSLEVSAHDADRILRPELLELLAGLSPVAGQVMNGANGHTAIMANLGGKMGAYLSSGLEDHSLPIIGINTAVRKNGRLFDDKNIQMKAALAAAQAEHGRITA